MSDKDSLDFEISFYEKLIHESPDYVDALIPLAEAYTRTGSVEKGLKIDQRLARLCPKDPIVHYNLACSYALTSHHDRAIQSLKRAVTLGYTDIGHLKQDPDLECLHDHPDFQKLLQLRRRTRPNRK